MNANKPDFMSKEDQEQVIDWEYRWEQVLQESVIVDLTITQWQPYAKLTQERLESLGARPKSEDARAAMSKVVRTGRFELVERKALAPIQSSAQRARVLLETHSHPLLWGRAVTSIAYPIWKAKHEAEVKAFNKAVNTLIDKLEQYRRETKTRLETMFDDAYTRLKRARAFDTDPGRSRFVQEAVAEVMRPIRVRNDQGRVVEVDPYDADLVRSKFSFATDFRFAPMMKEITQRQEDAAKTRKENLLEGGSLDEEREKAVQKMYAEVEKDVEARRTEILSSFAKAEAAFYRTILKVASSIRTYLDKKDSPVKPKAAEQLKSLAAQVRVLNIFGDKDVTKKLDTLREAIDRRTNPLLPDAARQEALDALQESLEDTVAYTRQQIGSIRERKVRGSRLVDESEGVVEAETRVRRQGSTQEELTFEDPVARPRTVNLDLV